MRLRPLLAVLFLLGSAAAAQAASVRKAPPPPPIVLALAAPRDAAARAAVVLPPALPAAWRDLGSQTRRTAQAVVSVLSPDLLRVPARANANLAAGHCYVAAEALYHLMGGKAAGWTPQRINWDGATHWFLKHRGGLVVDPTAAQFKAPVPYHKAVGAGFLTAAPSRRAAEVMRRVRSSSRPASLRRAIFDRAYRAALKGKGDVRFGAVVVDQKGRVIGAGRNRLSTGRDRRRFNKTDWSSRAERQANLDYAIHAEQAAIADALRGNKKPQGATVYVLGVRKDGLVGRRAHTTWTCLRCAVWIKYFGLRQAALLTRAGWRRLRAGALYATACANDIRGKAYWEKQHRGEAVSGVPSYEWVRPEAARASVR